MTGRIKNPPLTMDCAAQNDCVESKRGSKPGSKHSSNRGRKGLRLTVALLLAGTGVLAYSSGARDSLLKSRDQVADQKFQLERTYNEIDKKIDELEKQKYTISRYLQDCDRALKDIDHALNAQDAAYRAVR